MIASTGFPRDISGHLACAWSLEADNGWVRPHYLAQGLALLKYDYNLATGKLQTLNCVCVYVCVCVCVYVCVRVCVCVKILFIGPITPCCDLNATKGSQMPSYAPWIAPVSTGANNTIHYPQPGDSMPFSDCQVDHWAILRSMFRLCLWLLHLQLCCGWELSHPTCVW